MRQRKLCAVSVLCLFCLVLLGSSFWQKMKLEEMKRVMAEETAPVASPYAGVLEEFFIHPMAEVAKNGGQLVASANRSYLTQDAVFSFLQGPKSWEERRPWSGEWANEYVKGGYFGNFGCGLCCMANLYGTLTDYDCSPWDMYEYARQVSGYSPTGKTGAIGWGDMKTTLEKCGFHCTLSNKPGDYETFRQQISTTKGAVVLVCSSDDDTYWENTGGHYVNIWLYDPDTDTVFLSDPGSPTRNRSRIPLRYVYDALKTASQYQYLLADNYTEENNQWKQDGIDEIWTAP